MNKTTLIEALKTAENVPEGWESSISPDHQGIGYKIFKRTDKYIDRISVWINPYSRRLSPTCVYDETEDSVRLSLIK